MAWQRAAAQVLVAVAGVAGRAFMQAYQRAIVNAQNPEAAAKAAQTLRRGRDAMQVSGSQDVCAPVLFEIVASRLPFHF